MNIPDLLKKAGLKCTTQRRIVLEALIHLNNHPTADELTGYIHKTHPEIAQGTIYHILGVFLEKGLARNVMSDGLPLRYEFAVEKHHHLHFVDSGEIKDYPDPELDRILLSYFRDKGISDFRIDDIEVHIKGRKKNSDTIRNKEKNK